jgi:hypothetical protein
MAALAKDPSRVRVADMKGPREKAGPSSWRGHREDMILQR